MNPARVKIPKRLPAGIGPKIVVLAEAYGLRGLRGEDLDPVLPPGDESLPGIVRKLEEEGVVRILFFEPLFLVAREAISRFGEKLIPYLEKFHASHAKERGADLDRIQRRFVYPRAILLLGLRTLIHEGRLRRDGDAYALPGFKRELPPREEDILRRIEAECFAGSARSVRPAEIRDKLKLSNVTLDQMLDILVERRRVIAGPDGFYVHKPWLDDIVAKVRALGRRELSVAEFKALTGLSRKYAIPLLELLDAMEVTRRRGAARDIL